MSSQSSKRSVPAKWVGFGYLGAWRRLEAATVKAYGRTQPHKGLYELEDQNVFIALFETLNRLDSFLDRPEVAPLVDKDLHDAFWFVRGRVHHQWAEAIEFRKDVLLPPTVIGPSLGPRPPVVVADWCWKSAEAIPGGKRRGSDPAQLEYRRLLAGQPTRTALDQLASVASSVVANLWTPVETAG